MQSRLNNVITYPQRLKHILILTDDGYILYIYNTRYTRKKRNLLLIMLFDDPNGSAFKMLLLCSSGRKIID